MSNDEKEKINSLFSESNANKKSNNEDIGINPPTSIGSLKIIGNILLFMSIVFGFILLFNARECIDDCQYSFRKTILHVDRIIIGIALIFGGVIQQQLFYGLSAVIEQLFEIRKKT